MTNKRAFSAITPESAEHIRWGFRAAEAHRFDYLVLYGKWHRRRFVIEKSTAHVGRIPENPANPMSMTLALPVHIDADTLMRRCRSFGGLVERVWRDAAASFDRVVSCDDGTLHIVPAYHHVAVCGHKSSGWLDDDEVTASGVVVPSCAKCEAVSQSRPRHAARWHPIAAEDPPR